MRCFEWKEGTLQEGIKLTDSEGLVLGVDKARIPLHNENPARVHRGRVFNVYPFWVNPHHGDPFLTLAHPHEKHVNDPTILVHVSTYSNLRPAILGFWRGNEDEVKTLCAAEAHYKNQTWREGLVTIRKDGILRIRSEGSDDMWALLNSAPEPQTETWIRHEARMLLHEEGLL